MFVIGLGLVTIIILTLFIVAQFVIPTNFKEKFLDVDWSACWAKYDAAARANADCKPLVVINRKMGKVSPFVWIVPDSCEQGLPHTRAVDIIAIPKSLPKQRLAHTLEHEKIHLFQRANPSGWAKFYRIKWRYELYTKPPVGMPSELITMRRSNPDTADSPWCCWMNLYWPVPVYQSPHKLSLSNAIVKWWNQNDGSVTSTPEEWLNFFGTDIHQIEHPHEISAEWLAGPLYVNPNDCNGEVELPPDASQALRLLKDAWEEEDMMPIITST